MGFLDDILGGNSTLTDKDIAYDMLKDLKFDLHALTMAIAETNHPELREILKKQLNKCIDDKYILTDILVRKDWYHPYLTPQGQVNNDLLEAHQLNP